MADTVPGQRMMTRSDTLVPEMVRRRALDALQLFRIRRPIADIEYDTNLDDEIHDEEAGRQLRFRVGDLTVAVIVTTPGDRSRLTILVTPPARWVVRVRNSGSPITITTDDDGLGVVDAVDRGLVSLLLSHSGRRDTEFQTAWVHM